MLVKKNLINQCIIDFLHLRSFLGVPFYIWFCLLVYPQIALTKNLPKTIEHGHSHSARIDPLNTPNKSQIESRRLQQQAERQTEQARQDLKRARQDSRRFAPYQRGLYDNHGFDRLHAESELIRSQQELRNAEGNQYSLERRIESTERDAQLQRDRANTRSPRADFQRSYPKIEYGHRGRR